jgi:hypothetical protein
VSKKKAAASKKKAPASKKKTTASKKKATASKHRRPSKRARRPARSAPQQKVTSFGEGRVSEMAEEVAAHPETSPRLTGGDLDADWRTAHTVGEEAVGGSVATPDQDVVDELGAALGVPQDPDAEVRTSGEILRERDADRWRLEREAARERD